MRPSLRTKHRIQAAAAVFGTVAAVYGVSRLVEPSRSARASVPVPIAQPLPPSGPIVPRIDPPLAPNEAPAPPRASADFLAAAGDGDVAAMEKMYAPGMHLDGALGAAAASGKITAVEWLLDHGADVHEDEADPEAPILVADDHADIVKLLLAKGAQEPSLAVAAQAGRAHAVERLLRGGADPNAEPEDGAPPLSAAITGAHDVGVVKQLVAHGARVDETRLREALDLGDDGAPILDVLLGAKISPVTAAKALDGAAGDDGARLVKKLTPKGIAWSWRDDGGDEHAPLLDAVERLDVPVVRAMLEAGAPANQSGEFGRTPLGVTLQAAGGDMEEAVRVVRLLLARGADPNKRLDTGERPLVRAASLGDVRLVTMLLDRGARVNDGLMKEDETALEAADAAGHADVARVLRARGARTRPILDP